MKSVRTAFVIAAFVLGSGVSVAAFAGTKAPSPCSAHIKAMKGMKTAAEREAYCKDHEDCMSNKCMSHMSAHHKKSSSSSAAAPAPAPKPAQ
jgi:hypothetical protein